MVEVGPGPGGLTRALLETPLNSLTVIEHDRRCLPLLAELGAADPRLNVVAADALATDPAALTPPPRKLVANLPYNIATPLLTGWIASEPWPPWFASLTLMFQREVAERIVAQPGSGAYGRLSVLCGWRTDARVLFDVSPRAFVPSPKVTSAVVHLVPRARPLACDLGTLERTTAAAFGQRRKMLRQSLRSLGADVPGLLAAAGLDGTVRAQDVDVEGFVRLANAVR